ncbi:MAG: bifunctional 23S rRNA (guanine(2069)-N(7))-methyltransferase RlmK/23S rRNA (guanine(2445)-N(2))-methyltransferase RlmL [Gammaproteobacteria bacterium]|nr:bifunctional 23S rRNA (guanine(2069)-N(7))-methyltransferase RlmK/23S rRNA (guanine(2445)-N(2))-methyltransferase RlmL [Gammaproteobacteria bacterium]
MSDVFFVTCPKGVEYLLEDELKALGLEPIRQAPAGVWARGTLESGYRVCLWSRLANRVVLHLAELDAPDADALYEGAVRVPWSDHLAADGSFRIDFSGTNPGIRNSHFGAMRVKDALVDAMRSPSGARPSVSLENPDVRIQVHLDRERALVGLDLSGESLHRRGYRQEGALAPLKENLAAALLVRAGWPALAAQGADLVDPMCGSGTLLVEGAMMAMDRAPGLDRAFGFERWLGHVPALWRRLLDEARERAEQGQIRCSSRFWGFDMDGRVVATARRNAQRAGLAACIQIEQALLDDFRMPSENPMGLVITNPPYGERLSERPALDALYHRLGEQVRTQAQGWRFAVFTSVPELGHALGLRVERKYKLFNGKLPAQLLIFQVETGTMVSPRTGPRLPPDAPRPRIHNPERAQMLENRMRKNLRVIGGWARKQGITCYRLYDADMPEYAFAVDVYNDWLHVQEYAPPASVDPAAAKARLEEMLAVLPGAVQVPAERLVFKQRRRQAGTQQYEKQSETARRMVVEEGGTRLWVNLHDYLDTGLFLDHRPARRWVREQAKGKRVLNLFCYTGAVTAQAVAGGAIMTTSVDMSRTYLNWANDNLELNGFDLRRHHFEQADCLQWLKTPAKAFFDLIFLDPPTFSNSARMEGVLDVQRDHLALVEGAMKRLSPDGVLIFSNNYRRFRLDPVIAERWEVEDRTQWSLDKDFQRNAKIHQCGFNRHRAT